VKKGSHGHWSRRPPQPLSSKCSLYQRPKQGFGLLPVERFEAFGEAPVDLCQQLPGLVLPHT
jgi:hypothetical protein